MMSCTPSTPRHPAPCCFSTDRKVKSIHLNEVNAFWWRRVDSNHRSETQQIYSLPPLATRELLRMNLMELADGLEPPTC